MKPYVVQQGDTMSKLAAWRGFDARQVWSDPANADLAAKRRSMDVLSPGDVVQLPSTPPATLQIQAGTTNRFTAAVPEATLRFRLRKAGLPIANAKYRVRGTTRAAEGTTDADGHVTVGVPIVAREIQIDLVDLGLTYHVKIGDLDPHDEPSGVRMRLANLGYLSADAAKQSDLVLRRAIAAFQASHGLEPTGELDVETIEALASAHGH